MAKFWMGTPPAKCDICSRDITKAFVDGATTMGPWANMCDVCHLSHGVGLGTGKGQRYKLDKKSGRWLKVEG